MTQLIEIIKMTEDAILPERAYPEDAGCDLFSAEDVTIHPGTVEQIGTGIRINIPSGLQGKIVPKSGLALKYMITVLNSPGTIDSGYQGEILVLLVNYGSKPYRVEKHSKIAQLIITPVVYCEFKEVDSFEQSARGLDGFGSTGMFQSAVKETIANHVSASEVEWSYSQTRLPA